MIVTDEYLAGIQSLFGPLTAIGGMTPDELRKHFEYVIGHIEGVDPRGDIEPRVINHFLQGELWYESELRLGGGHPDDITAEIRSRLEAAGFSPRFR